MNDILKALASPVRMDMLKWLKEPEQYFGEQAQPFTTGVSASQFERCGLSQSTVSAHLSVLQRAGLVTTSRHGQWVYYRRDENAIRRFLADLQSTL
ncbi:helix-turn-helix transcriptional regulator [Ciceribacter sp. L1K23]|uniref:ArsR/SmtB family transcription factor n=1 Tax=unclassified Ciceribacter TaxID=2628820 RepID=UPI001ABECA70|nr:MULTISPECIES: metalloregulator ArsR/SmtB family transcription factor [unclassified Ciceribacter]MBO3760971.1 helix-turn-helix transcriptional regulator [Ciceribacter sp. L1K22]MBR0554955.1 helix-turn-helix transcriptional regulator [Ciceribacter sp. L1K23]